MIKFFRNFFDSKFGVPVTLAFLALIAVAFASADITGTTFGGVSGGDRVAVVGDQKISTSDLAGAATTTLDRVRAQNPTMSMPAFIAAGRLDEVLEQLINRTAIGEFGRVFGLRTGDNLVNSEIVDVPMFRGPDGNFDQKIYQAWLGQQRLTDSQFRAELGQGLMAQQLLAPLDMGATSPDKVVLRYAALQKERRMGAIGLIPSAVFAPTGNPSDQQLSAYYTSNRGDYIRPERRVIRYATFDTSTIADSAEPTDNEIAARYEENKAQFAASEDRTLSQLIVPTQQAANTIRERVTGGGSLEQAAREAGLSVAQIGPVSRQQLASQTSAAVAQAVFAAGQGTVAAPARSGLGWHVVRVDNVNSVPARTLAQVRGDIADSLRVEKMRHAVADLSASIEERLSGGEALSAVAQSLNVELQTTRPITADGAVYGTGDRAPQDLAPALQTAFQMEEGEPQIAEIVPGQLFMIFEASEITESAAAPLREIRERVVADWRRAQGLAAARQAADRVLARVKRGEALDAAMRAENARLTDIDAVNMSREELAEAGGRIPPPLALLFSMAKGTGKRLEAPANTGWFVVSLRDIEEGTLTKDDPIFQQAKRQLGQVSGEEQGRQFVAAMRAAVGVERNATAIEAVRKQLVGEN